MSFCNWVISLNCYILLNLIIHIKKDQGGVANEIGEKAQEYENHVKKKYTVFQGRENNTLCQMLLKMSSMRTETIHFSNTEVIVDLDISVTQ